jgi:hypothetical protein
MPAVDAFKGHLTQEVKGEIRKANIYLIMIPVGMTSQLQLSDVVANKHLIGHLRRLYNDWFLRGNNALTPSGKLKTSISISAWGMDPDCLGEDFQ